jgi:hypothetical protein
MFNRQKPVDDEALAIAKRRESIRQVFGALRDQVSWHPNTSADEIGFFYVHAAQIIENYIENGVD